MEEVNELELDGRRYSGSCYCDCAVYLVSRTAHRGRSASTGARAQVTEIYETIAVLAIVRA